MSLNWQVLDEEVRNVHVALQNGAMERTKARGLHICAVADEELNHVHVAIPSCRLQRVILISVHICAVL